MSGLNPFRHSRKPVPETTFPNSQRVNHGSGPAAWETTNDNNNNTSPRHSNHDVGETGFPFPGRDSPRTKTVRIASPPARSISFSSRGEGEFPTPDEEYGELRNPSTHRGSPPPRQNATRDMGDDEDEDEDEDPFNPDNSGSEDERNSDMNRSSPGVQDQESPRQRPLSGEMWGGGGNGSTPAGHGYNRNSFISDSGGRSGSGSGSSSGGKRSTMDVDAFKRLLLTGDPGSATAAAPPSQPQPIPVSGSAGNTETGLGLNSPTFGTQSVPADSGSRRASGDNSMFEKKGAKPPPPKTRKGKVIGNSPDRVSASFPLTSAEPRTSLYNPQQSMNNHKPLPSIPTGNIPPPVPDRRVAALSESSPKPAAPHKRPPTPPMSRRHSQMRKNDNPSISRSNSARVSHPPANPSMNSSPLSSSNAFSPKNPPPPPSRRADRTSIVFSSPDNTSSSSSSSQPGLPFPSESLSGIPNSELDQTSDKSSLHRSGSGSTISTKRQSRVSAPQPSSSNVPPRPPPPRRTGGTKAGSMSDSSSVLQQPQLRPQQQHEHRHQSQHHSSSDQGNETITTGDPARSNASDILADLSRLQKELDELRGQHDGRRPSQ